MPKPASELEMRQARLMLQDLAAETNKLFERIKKLPDSEEKREVALELYNGIRESLGIKAVEGSQ